MDMNSCPSTISAPSAKFLKSTAWEDQLVVLTHDHRRMSGINHIDVAELMSTYASNVASGYTQGYLYLLRTMAWVFGRDQIVLYWAFVRAVDIVRPFGPLGKEMGVRNRALVIAMENADEALDKKMLAGLVAVRWGFVLFAQTFTHKEHLLNIWDLIIGNRDYIGYVMAAILHVVRFEDSDPMERLSKTIDVQIDTVEQTSRIIAVAHLMHNVHAPNTKPFKWASKHL